MVVVVVDVVVVVRVDVVVVVLVVVVAVVVVAVVVVTVVAVIVVFVFSEKASMIAAIAAAIKMLVKIPRTQQYRQQSKYSLEKTHVYIIK